MIFFILWKRMLAWRIGPGIAQSRNLGGPCVMGNQIIVLDHQMEHKNMKSKLKCATDPTHTEIESML